MRRLLLVILAICLVTGTAFSGEIHCKHFWQGMPLGVVETNDLIIRDCYAVSTNDETKFADWVAYRLTCRETEGTLPLKRIWETEPSLDNNETLEAMGGDDYLGAARRYDRGHLVPLASFRGSVNAQQVNRYSVVVPQRISLNRGVWNTIEKWERELVEWYGTVYTVNGTLYEREMIPLVGADEDHQVPSGFWKIMVFRDGFIWKSVSFIVDQQVRRGTNPTDCLVSINEIEKRTKLILFSDLSLTRAQSFKGAINKLFVVEELQKRQYSE